MGSTVSRHLCGPFVQAWPSQCYFLMFVKKYRIINTVLSSSKAFSGFSGTHSGFVVSVNLYNNHH